MSDPYGQPVQPSGPPTGQQPSGTPPYTYGYPPGYPPTYPPGGPYQRPTPDPSSSRSKAIWALVLAILPLCGVSWIVSLVLAIMVLSGPRDGQPRGRGMAWASIVIVVLWVIAAIVGVIVAIGFAVSNYSVERDADGQVTSRGDLFPEELRVGDCLDEDVPTPDETDWTETVVPCDDPHSGQIYLLVELDGSQYPSLATIRETADARCADGFESWVGVPVESSELTVSYLYPDEDNWGYDREIKCIAVPPTEATGTLEGSGR